MKYINRFTAMAFLLFAGFTNAVAQESFSALQKKADALIQSELYFPALLILENLTVEKPGSDEIKEKLAACYFHTNHLDKARELLTPLSENNAAASAENFYYLAVIYHEKFDFAKAATYYKEFLKRTPQKHPLRETVKEEIRRCAFGLRNNFPDNSVFVENLGENVNSTGDDFAPVFSPTEEDKLYFSTAREGSLGGRRNQSGLMDETTGKYSADMYYTYTTGSQWSKAAPLSYILNTSRHDAVLDFSEGGARMYYFKGYTLTAGEILVDTFNRKNQRQVLFPANFESPLRPEVGDISLQFFNDSILLFASNRAGGYGGMDLYMTVFSQNGWLPPLNLGPVINSAYDETTPFLAKDGRTLYFSSDHSDRSFGGLDIFRSVFTDEQEAWSTPENLGLPINSAGDDAHFRLAKDGMKAYFSSSRRSGSGERDIWSVHFPNFRTEMADFSVPLTFVHVQEFKKRIESASHVSEAKTASVSSLKIPKTYSLEHLYFDKESNLLTGKNLAEIKNLSRFLIENPNVRVQLNSHSDDSEPAKSDLFFSIKRAEKVSDFLIQNGVAPSQIVLKGCGSKYPRLTGTTASAMRQNRRIEFTFSNLDAHLTVQLPATLTDAAQEYNYFLAASAGLSYKVQIATTQQMYSGDLIVQVPHAMVESFSGSKEYLYTVGWYKTFLSAEQLRQELQGAGIKNAFVVPYINGFRVSEKEAQQFKSKYPDLENYLNFKAEKK